MDDIGEDTGVVLIFKVGSSVRQEKSDSQTDR